MNYPLILEYIEAIKSAEDNFEQLKNLRPVLGDDGLPVMTSGNFAVVFKMKDEQSGKFYAVKCFTKEQEGRAEAYQEIAKELKDVSSPYLVSIQYLEKELFVDTDQTTETEFPVLLMDWVEGKTLDKYLRENLDDKYALEMLAYRFSQLAQWLIPQPFAHGDLKPDNIIVCEDGTLVLVDYDGMYVPAMKGQKARELGSPDFRHPQRTEDDFDEHIDDFPLVSILLSLKAISYAPHLLEIYGVADRLIFSKIDYFQIEKNEVIRHLISYNNTQLNYLISILISLTNYSFPFSLPVFERPHKKGLINGTWIYDAYKLNEITIDSLAPASPLSLDVMLNELIELDEFLRVNGIEYILTGSLGLYIHGFTPLEYKPHDIDIIVLNRFNLLELFSLYYGKRMPEYDDKGRRMFIFSVGVSNVEINAFCYDELDPSKYKSIRVLEHEINVHNVLDICEEKFKMCRLKDYQFSVAIQSQINNMFH